MVRGLDVFREYFSDHADQFVLIGLERGAPDDFDDPACGDREFEN
jgi:hypothetical protein